MKKGLLIIPLLSFLFTPFVHGQCNSWVQKASLTDTARSGAIGMAIGNKGYIGLGEDKNFVLRKDFWEYDPGTDAWTQKADFQDTARYNAIAFAVNGKGYVGTGLDNNFKLREDLWEYDPGTNNWTQKSAFGGTPRAWATAFSIGNKGYVGTGYDTTNSFVKDFWEYDPGTDAWTQLANFGGSARNTAVGFSVQGKGYIGLGSDISGRKFDFWEYDPSTNNWSSIANYPGGIRDEAFAFSIGKLGFVGGGVGGGNLEQQNGWLYHPTNDAWYAIADFGGGPRKQAIAFTVNRKGYVGLGSDDNNDKQRDLWEYTPPVLVDAGPDTIILCQAGDSVMLGGSPAGLSVYSSGLSYSWSPATNLSNANAANPIATPTDTTDYILTVTDSIGCSKKDTITILTPVQAVHSIALDSQVTCYGLSDGGGHVRVTRANFPVSYYWLDEDTTLNSPDSTSGLSNKPAGTYRIEIVDDYGCVTVDSLVITEPAPLQLATDSLPASPGNSDGTAWVVPSGGTSPYNYQWEGGISTDDTAANLSAGTYSVTVTDQNGCMTVDSVTVTESSGIQEAGQESMFSVYPTVNNGAFVVLLEDNNTDFTGLRVLDLTGTVVYRDQITTGQHKKQLQLDLSAGVYFIRVQTDTRQQTRKIIVE